MIFRRRAILLTLLLAWSSLAPHVVVQAAEKVEWFSGKKYDWALDQQVVATWQNAPLRDVVRALSEQRQVPVVFDRRLDPQCLVTLSTQSESLRAVWPVLAKVVDGAVSNTGHAVYLGPAAAAGKLRTLIALRQADLQQVAAKLPTSRKQPLLNKQPLRWNDLDEPRQILSKLTEEHGVEIIGLDRIPHDLWAAADLPAITLAEAATLALIQFDLTFQTQLDGQTAKLQLIPIPEKVTLEKTWALPRAKQQALAEAVQNELPDVTTQTSADQLMAWGTEEELEELEELLRNVTTGSTRRKKTVAPAPLSKRRLTFQAKDAKLSAILEKLSETGIQFEYDRAELKAAGIDIDQLVAIDAKNVRPEELFDGLFKPAKIGYQIDGLKVTLKPTVKSN